MLADVYLSLPQILILAVWFGMTIIGLIVLGAIRDDHLSTGNPYRLTNAIDYDGRICGFDSGVKDLKKAYYMPDLTGRCPSRNVLRCNYVDPDICRPLMSISGVHQRVP